MNATFDNERLEALLRRCAGQDAAALQDLYRLAAPQLLGVLLRMLRTRAAAEDALQDVFIRVWQQAGQFDDQKGRAMSWLVSIARNRAIDLQRRQRPMLVIEAAELSDPEQLSVAGPAQDTEFQGARAALQRCLGLLGDLQRRCVVMAYEQGLTQEQIAQSVGHPIGTVKSWIRRSLQNLRQCLEP